MPFSPKSVFSPLPRTKRATSVVLHGDPKGRNMLYTVGRSVIIRDIENSGGADVYTQHSVEATAACYAPSGFYIASGDVSGKIRIWDTTQKEHILKYEYQPIAGAIKDIAWSPDSKRIAVCGEGREKFGHVFLWDSGSSVGEIMGHSKFINSIDYRPSRPFRVATGGEDKKVCWFEGPPFRYKNTFTVSSSPHHGVPLLVARTQFTRELQWEVVLLSNVGRVGKNVEVISRKPIIISLL
jgi:WD40 repeat protein